MTDPVFRTTRTTMRDRKAELLRRARSGEAKPGTGDIWYNRLIQYTASSSRSYDAAFADAIYAVRPDWKPAVSLRGRPGGKSMVEANKRLILALAASGANLPPDLETRLQTYTTVASPMFDAKFALMAMHLAPDWFEARRLADRKIGKATLNKEILLELAQSGLEKPSRKTRLGQVLSTYVSSAHRSYDPAFVDSLFAVRPDWI